MSDFYEASNFGWGDWIRRSLLVIIGSVLLSSAPAKAREPDDYKGAFSTQVLYDLCSRKDDASKDKCMLYIQGLLSGLTVGRLVLSKSLAICVPKMDIENARQRILDFIDRVTDHHPANNRDGGDWMAFLALSEGHVCKR